jgi:UDP-N-acetylmuramoyl-tripeptide--D-alanyl-D-alanine ligase
MKKIGSFLQDYSGFKNHLGEIDNVQYQNLSIDTRTIKQGQLYIALKGENFDGHDFVTHAIEKKAGGVVVEEKWYAHQPDMREKNTIFIVVSDTLNFLQQLSSWHRHHFQIPVIGITGSNGKTTTKKMVVESLLKTFSVVNTEGNQNNHVGVPLTLLKIRSDHELAVIEMGSNHPGEIELLANLVNPTMALITNIGKGHIGYFGNLESIYREKTALFDQLSKDSTIFKNMEDPFLRRYNRSDVNSVEIGTSSKYDIWGRIDSVNKYGCIRFILNDKTSIQLQLPGAHHFSNALIASAVAIHAVS